MEDDYSTSDDELLSSFVTKPSATPATWKRQTVISPKLKLFDNTFPEALIDKKKPMDFFEQCIDDNIYELMATCTNQKAVILSGKSLKLCATDIKHFFGVTILMSCIGYPRLKLFWKQSLRVPIIADCMKRDIYFKIRNNLKVV